MQYFGHRIEQPRVAEYGWIVFGKIDRNALFAAIRASADEHINLFAGLQTTPAVHLVDDRSTQLWMIDCSGAPIAARTRWAQLTTWL
jgi:hypothetical protein